MKTIFHIWNTLIQSNTFNFIVMLGILYWLINKFNVLAALENLKNSIIDSIIAAENERKSAKENLLAANKSVENTETEISEKINLAKLRANDIEKEIVAKTENKIKQIENNIEKVVKIEEKKISSRLTLNAADEAFYQAKEQVISYLKENPQMHEKCIIQSIEEL